MPTQEELNKQWINNLNSTDNHYWDYSSFPVLTMSDKHSGNFIIKKTPTASGLDWDTTEHTYTFKRALSASKAEYIYQNSAYKGNTFVFGFSSQEVVLEINPWNYTSQFTEAVQKRYIHTSIDPNFITDVLYRLR